MDPPLPAAKVATTFPGERAVIIDSGEGVRVGIIGAGQLGAYLCRAARQLGMHTTVLAASPDDIAVPFADAVVLGEDRAAAACLPEQVDVVTYEKEDIPGALLDTLDARGNLVVAPDTGVLRLLQNKARQKHWLARHGFPTSEFRVLDGHWRADALAGELGDPWVLKTQTGGYDGLGVKVVRAPEDTEAFAGVACIAERFVAHDRELAVVVARGRDGQLASFPVCQLNFDAHGNVLRSVVAPAPVPAATAREATDLATAVVAALKGVGVFAVELFQATDGTLLVNEISPRVHNSGHLTLEACSVTQFELHLRAISGMSLPVIEQRRPAAMVNVLCEAPAAPGGALPAAGRFAVALGVGPYFCEGCLQPGITNHSPLSILDLSEENQS